MERRKLRSQDPYRALCFQLEHSRSQGDLRAVVLATPNGLVVAQAGEPQACEALGAVAPLVKRSKFSGKLPDPLRGEAIAVRPMSIGGEKLFVASLGAGRKRDLWLARSIDGVRRILDAA